MNKNNELKHTLFRSATLVAVGALALLGVRASAQGAPTPPRQAPQLAIAVCGTCHGVDGNSINPMFPRLAGQRKWYLKQQLHEFKNESRGDPYAVAYMWGMANQLSNKTIDALADYFSAQKTGPGAHHSAGTVAAGRAIFQGGLPTQGVPPCAACHGPSALGTKMAPRLAGQHAEYIMKQLESFQDNMRNVAVMHGVAMTLHRKQMKMVADYLESLR